MRFMIYIKSWNRSAKPRTALQFQQALLPLSTAPLLLKLTKRKEVNENRSEHQVKACNDEMNEESNDIGSQEMINQARQRRSAKMKNKDLKCL